MVREKLSSILAPSYLQITNESPRHGLSADAEKHFSVVVVSETFAGVSRVDRHRHVNTILADELRDHVHALSLQTFTPAEWRERGETTFGSPDCMGGGKRDR